MTTLVDVYSSTDFMFSLKDESMPLYWTHEDGSKQYWLQQPDGCTEYSFHEDAPVEVFVDGTLTIDGITFTGHVSNQVYFTPDQE